MFKNIFNTSKTVIYTDSKGNVEKIVDEEEILKKYNISPIEEFEKKYNIIENKNSDNYLYYFTFKFKDKSYYKIGITSTSLEKRYGNEFKKIEKVLYLKKIDLCMKTEKKILKEFQNDLFPLKYFNSGHSEVFDRDVLTLNELE